MKILWLHQYFATPRGWGAVRTHAFARRFVQAGHAVDVVCGAGYDASLRSAGGSPEVIDGVRVFVSGTAYRPYMGFLRRVWSFLCFMAYALGFVLRRGGDYDVMIASSGPLTLAVPALIGRWFRGIPFVFEVIDVWPDSAIAAGVLKNPVLKWLSFRLEALAYKYASAIVTCSTGMTERVEVKLGEGECKNAGMPECLNEGGSNAAGAAGSNAAGAAGSNAAGAAGSIGPEASFNRPGGLVQGEEDISHGGMARIEESGGNGKRGGARKKRVVTISNCCDLGEFVPDGARREAIRARYGVREDQTVVLYTGAMGLSNAVDDLVEAVRGTAGDERIVWWFAGGGPEERKLRESSHRGTENAEGGGERSALVRECVSALVEKDGERRTEDGERSALVRECESSKVGGSGTVGNRQSAIGNGEKTANRANRANGEISRKVGNRQSAIGNGEKTANRANRANGEISRQDAKTQRAIEPLNEREARLNPVEPLNEREARLNPFEPLNQAAGRLNPVEPLNQAAGRLNLDPLEPTQQARFFGSLPKVELIDLYLAADVNVVTFMHEPLFYENSPNKFFDGIAAGLPAVFNRTTWLEPWLEAYGCGIVCTNQAAGAEMALHLKRLVADGERRKQMGRNARRLAEEVFDRDKLAEKYLKILRGVAR